MSTLRKATHLLRIISPIAVVYTVIVLVLLSLTSCVKHGNNPINTDISLCAFIISDNDLDDHTVYIENDFVRGLKGCPVGTELFLYIDRQIEMPSLRHLILLESGQVAIKKTWNYDEQCSTSLEVFRNILSTMIKNSSGRQYGLFYWSHGNGWLPGLNPDQANGSSTRSLGADGAYSMNTENPGHL